MPGFPVNAVMFSGFGDSATYKFLNPAASWADLGQPTISPSPGSGGCTGLATYSNGKVVHTGGTFSGALTRSFNTDFSIAGTIPGADGATGELNIACDGAGNCYHIIKVAGVFKIAKAAAGDSAWTQICMISYAAVPADDPGVLAVNQAGTVAYFSSSYHRTPGGNPLTVYKVDLGTGTTTTFKTNTITLGSILEAILVLPDNSVVIAWGAGSSLAYPRRYDSSGTELTGYNSLPDNYYSATGIALAYASDGTLDSSSFFMAWYSDTPGSGVTVARINASTGAVVGTRFQPPSDGFEYDGPITALRTVSAPPPPPTPPPVPPPPVPEPIDPGLQCCSTDTPPGTTPGTGALPPSETHAPTPFFIGGGDVETAPDLIDSESWT
jgi:hypothetical protein